jgi:hypothetical protein
MNKTTGTYLRHLGLWLRVQGVEGPRIVTVLSDVRAHVTESGENPFETFGEPRVYAKAFAEGSRRRWLWIASFVVAFATFAASIYLLASEIAARRDFRPLPLGGHAWLIITTGVVAALISWRAFLVVAVRPLSSLAYGDDDAATSWSKWSRHRRYATLAIALAVAIGSLTWGVTLGKGFRNSPKLQVSNYVWATAGSLGSPGQDQQSITVSTVIYQSARGPKVMLTGLSLSVNWDANWSASSNLVAFPTLATALTAAHNHIFSGAGRTHSSPLSTTAPTTCSNTLE